MESPDWFSFVLKCSKFNNTRFSESRGLRLWKSEKGNFGRKEYCDGENCAVKLYFIVRLVLYDLIKLFAYIPMPFIHIKGL